MSFVIWMTGLPCSGKTTLAKKLQENLINLEILDGDNLMDDLVAGTGSLSNGTQTGWSKQGRLDHTKRVAYVAKLLLKHNVPVCVSVISPFKESREIARKIIDSGRFIETYIKCSLELCRKRDVKDLYKKAENGELENLSGITGTYDIPQNPDLIIDTERFTVNENIQTIITFLNSKNFL